MRTTISHLPELPIASLALALALASAACSDSSSNSNHDAGKTDSSVELGRSDLPPQSSDAPTDLPMYADLPAQADLPLFETGPIDTRPADAPTAPDRAADGVADAPIVSDGGIDRTVDSAIDGAGIDGAGALVSRGKYLVDHVIACSDCHTPKTETGAPDMSRYLAGNAKFVLLPDGSALGSRNLTPDPTTGLANYTDAQIKRMFTDGVTPEGVDAGTRALNPIMPYYVFHNMTSQDADAIVAYLRSIPPVINAVPPPSPAFVVAAPANYLDPTTIPTPAASYPQRDSALRGRYLAAESGLCIECHTPHPASGPNAIDPTKYFQGGEDFTRFFIGTLNIHPVSANLTSDPTTGLGDWTTDQIVTVLQQGKDDHGDGICPPMPVGPTGAYGGLTAQDALDIANYIKSLPPAVNDVPDMCTWPPGPPVDAGSVLDGSSPTVDGPMSLDVGRG